MRGKTTHTNGHAMSIEWLPISYSHLLFTIHDDSTGNVNRNGRLCAIRPNMTRNMKLNLMSLESLEISHEFFTQENIWPTSKMT